MIDELIAELERLRRIEKAARQLWCNAPLYRLAFVRPEHVADLGEALDGANHPRVESCRTWHIPQFEKWIEEEVRPRFKTNA